MSEDWKLAKIWYMGKPIAEVELCGDAGEYIRRELRLLAERLSNSEKH